MGLGNFRLQTSNIIAGKPIGSISFFESRFLFGDYNSDIGIFIEAFRVQGSSGDVNDYYARTSLFPIEINYRPLVLVPGLEWRVYVASDFFYTDQENNELMWEGSVGTKLIATPIIDFGIFKYVSKFWIELHYVTDNSIRAGIGFDLLIATIIFLNSAINAEKERYSQ